MHRYLGFIFIIVIIVSCRSARFYGNGDNGIVFVKYNRNSVYLIEPKSKLICAGMLSNDVNGNQKIQYFLAPLQFEKMEVDSFSRFYLEREFYGQDIILSRDMDPGLGDYKSEIGWRVSFDFSLDSFYVINRSSDEVFGPVASPAKGCYKLYLAECPCKELYSRTEYSLLQKISEDSLLIGEKLFTEQRMNQQTRRVINGLSGNCDVLLE